jgi:hypothetical protein
MRFKATILFLLVLVVFVLIFSGCGQGGSGCPEQEDQTKDGSPSQERTFASDSYTQPPPPPVTPCTNKEKKTYVSMSMDVQKELNDKVKTYLCNINVVSCKTNLSAIAYFKSDSLGDMRYFEAHKGILVKYDSQTPISGKWGKTIYGDYKCYLELRDRDTNTLITDEPNLYYCSNDTKCYACELTASGSPANCNALAEATS